jgi:26S proteasome regulatory subunit N5
LDPLLNLEKQTRIGTDTISNSRVLMGIIDFLFKRKDYKTLNETLVSLMKKHGLLKQSATKMIQHAISLIDTVDLKTKLELVDTLRAVMDGKIFVEVERARLTRVLSKIKEEKGEIVEAADILQELQVNTVPPQDSEQSELSQWSTQVFFSFSFLSFSFFS